MPIYLAALWALLLCLGCTTAGQHDCFEFGVQKCVGFYGNLSKQEQNNSAGKSLRKQICKSDGMKCVEEPGTDVFAVELRMARQGFVSKSVSTKDSIVRGFFESVEKNPSLKTKQMKIMDTGVNLKKCENDSLKACEKLLNFSLARGILSGMNWNPSHDRRSLSRIAKKKICSSKKYKCLTLKGSDPFKVPNGWESVSNSASTSMKNGKSSSQRKVILRKTP